MRLLPWATIGALALPTICMAMAPPSAALAPVVPAKAVSLDEAVRGLIEMCTDYAGNSQSPFTEDKVKWSFAQDKMKRLGFELRSGNTGYSVRAPTNEGVMFAGTTVSGSCMINPAGVPWPVFAHAFSAAFDNASGYVRDTRFPSPTATHWRGQKVHAEIHRLNPGAVVRISRAPDR